MKLNNNYGKQLQGEKKPTLRALKIDVEREAEREELHVMPIAYNEGEKIKPATSVDETLQTYDIVAEDYDVRDSRKLQEMGMNSAEIKAHQNAINSRVTNRGVAEKRNKQSQQQSGPSIGE